MQQRRQAVSSRARFADEPTTFANFLVPLEGLTEEGEPRHLELELWDTAGESKRQPPPVRVATLIRRFNFRTTVTTGQEGFEKLRTLSYPGTDIYIIGFSCASMTSLRNIEHKWIKEINESREELGEDANGEPWIIMVGTKVMPRNGGIHSESLSLAFAHSLLSIRWIFVALR